MSHPSAPRPHAVHHAGCGCGHGAAGLSRRRLLLGSAAMATAAGSGLGLTGCTANPATGRSSFTAFSDIGDDVQVGAREYPKLLEAFGTRTAACKPMWMPSWCGWFRIRNIRICHGR